MSAVVSFPVVWILAVLSPLIAIFLAVFFYARHCRERPERDRRIPIALYVVVLLICTCIAYWLGVGLGAAWACSIPKSGNLCGLIGVFVVGPLVASLAVISVASLTMLLPSDRTT
jgi:purine-cytosine permease-like protein